MRPVLYIAPVPGNRATADLARLSLLYGRQRAASAESAAVRSLVAASKDTFAAADQTAKALLPHVYRRERAAILSCAVFAKSAETRRRIERVATVIEQDQPAAQKRLEDVAAARAAEIGVTRTLAVPTEADRRAAHLVPVSETGKRLTGVGGVMPKVTADPAIQVQKIRAALMGAMAAMRARGESELRLMGLPNAPATWVDGTRSILDIANAMTVEYAPIGAEALEAYFRAFEKAGAMKIVEK